MNRIRRIRCRIAWVLLLGAACGCEPSDIADPRPAPAGVDPLHHRRSDEDAIGWVTYRRYCIGCHGARGDGKGEAARFLFPKPRDFTQGLYKFVSRAAGSVPTDDDLIRTITYGLPRSSMPAFPLLSQSEKRGLVRVLKGFYPDWGLRAIEPTITFHANPFDMDTEFSDDGEKAIALGEKTYHGKAACWNCHPAYLSQERLDEIGAELGIILKRENIHQPLAKEDSWGQMIPPPDFRTMKLKSVRTTQDLYRVIAAGVGGTAMPTWESSLSAEELWAMTLYVEKLVADGRAARVAAVRKEGS